MKEDTKDLQQMSVKPQINLALAGIGGYGEIYLHALLDSARRDDVRFVGAVDPHPAGCKQLLELSSRQIPIYPTMGELYRHHHVDLMALASPIQFHCEQTELALAHGSHVLCEKPLAGSVSEIDRMIAARDDARRMVAIGYQWSFCPVVRRMLEDVRSGKFGHVRKLKAMALWPRDVRYYSRNSWAGRKHDSAGRAVFDSPMNNACAHFLHNMFQVVGAQSEAQAEPRDISAELYRAYPVDNFDTVVMRCHAHSGAEILFISSHCTQHTIGPELLYTFDHGTIELGEATRGHLVARTPCGEVIDYGCPASSADATKLWATVDAIRNGTPTLCSIEAAAAQTRVVCATQALVAEATTFPENLIRIPGEPARARRWVVGLEEALRLCFDRAALPRELGFDWSASTEAPPHKPSVNDSLAAVS